MSLMRFPGGKAKLAKIIVTKLSEQAKYKNVQYREVCFGGGSIGVNFLLANPQIKSVWINDVDVGVASLWTAVIRYPDLLKEQILAFKPCVAAFFVFQDDLTSVLEGPLSREDIVDIGFKKLAIHQISYSGLGTKSGGPLGGINQKSNYKIDCRWSPTYICKKVDKLHALFKTVKVHDDCCTSFDFANLIEDNTDSALLYIDPPYYVKGNDLYQYGFTKEDHSRLSEWLKITSHQWLLSYDNCYPIRHLYNWANVEFLDVNYSITALKDKETGERSSRTKSELLITKGVNSGCLTQAS